MLYFKPLLSVTVLSSLSLFALPTLTHALSITLDSGELNVSANNGPSTGHDHQQNLSPTLPLSLTLTAHDTSTISAPAAFVTSNYTYTNDSSGASFANNFSGEYPTWGGVQVQDILTFTTTETYAYEFSGVVVSTGGTPLNSVANSVFVRLQKLQEVGTPSLIYLEGGGSNSTSTATSIIGIKDGSDTIIGSPVGVIDPGTYTVHFNIGGHHRFTEPQEFGITAEYAFTLQPISIVPLPAATWMALPLLGGLGVTQLIRRKQLAA